MLSVHILFALLLDSPEGNFPYKVQTESCLLRYLLICRSDFIKDSKQVLELTQDIPYGYQQVSKIPSGRAKLCCFHILTIGSTT